MRTDTGRGLNARFGQADKKKYVFAVDFNQPADPQDGQLVSGDTKQAMIEEQVFMRNGDTSACFYQLMTQHPAGAGESNPGKRKHRVF
jgi:hypothetical protein